MADPTKDDLLARAASLGVEVDPSSTKAEIAAAIESPAAVGELEPSTPDEVGRPELVAVAEERAANRKPRRVIGEDATTEED